MKALSLSRPWPVAILHLGKRIENRKLKSGRMPPMCRYRGPLFLHAAKSWDEDAHVWVGDNIAEHRGWSPYHEERDIPPGVIFAQCRVVGHIEPAQRIDHGAARQLVLDGLAPPLPEYPTDKERADRDRLLKDFADKLDTRWHMPDQYGLVLVDLEPTPLVPCRGALGLWTPPPDVLAQLAPYVCPGCHAVAPDHCAPGCIDAAIEDERVRREDFGEDDEAGNG